VFLDTNVLASGFGTRGLCADVVREVLAKHDLVTGEVVLRELEKALDEQFGLPEEIIGQIIALLRRGHVEPEPRHWPRISRRDADDLLVLASAPKAKADVLVSGDKDLLAIKDDAEIRIVDPRQFWNLLKKKQV
jgi:putative PIN family toxin of toxin-antitoxin system